MTNVTIQGKEMGAALVYQAEKCRFSNITVSGKATIGGAGIVYSANPVILPIVPVKSMQILK